MPSAKLTGPWPFARPCEAAAQDVILLAGKGHEPYQDMGSLRLPFSDVEQAGAALALRRSKQEETA